MTRDHFEYSPVKTVLLLVVTTFLGIPNVYSQAREWTSKDGRTIMAEGLQIDRTSVLVNRSDLKSKLAIPFNSLKTSDVIWAVENLPLRFNDYVRLEAATKKQLTDKFERETGNYAVSLSFYSYGSGSIEASGTISPITETVKESGRIVEVTLSSLSSDGAVAVEFYSLTGEGSSKKIAKIETGVFAYEKFGSKLIFETPTIENFSGWVVVARSLNTGKIVATTGSMNHLTEFVKNQAPASVTFDSDSDALKELILAPLVTE